MTLVVDLWFIVVIALLCLLLGLLCGIWMGGAMVRMAITRHTNAVYPSYEQRWH